VRKAGWLSVGCAIAAGILFLVSYILNWQSSDIVDGLTTLLPVPIAFACGLTARRYAGLAACVWIAVIGEVGGPFNPFILVIVLGPWLAGAVVQERQQMTKRLEEVGRELESESQLLAEEAVRLERARIARELHDVVAHCVSVMVVQAYAGERLVATDPDSASEAFDHIAIAADQAKEEISHLVDLLDGTSVSSTAVDLARSLRDLADGAAATGLDVKLHVTGRPDAVSADASAVAYRVVQEGVTNALKHSPGAPILISVDCATDLTVDVINSPGEVAAEPLASTGGGHGLTGIRARVAAAGGSFAAGPGPAGAWRVSVRIPAA
jgi:signal transduction histidine kinase